MSSATTSLLSISISTPAATSYSLSTLTPPTNAFTSSESTKSSSTPADSTSAAISFVTPSPTSTPSFDSSTSPNIVELHLHTTILIPDFSRYYKGDIRNFHPNYHALADGSLVATPFISDLRSANLQLAYVSAFIAFFCITSWSAIQYIRRGKVKRKGLFYALLASQILGLGASVIVIVPFFNQFISCARTWASGLILATLSYTVLMTGILGFKAYRCLDSSKSILVVLGVVRATIFSFLALELAKTASTRRLSGGCSPTFTETSLGIILLLHAAESAFISGCLLCAVWKASRSSAVWGRVSISVSVRDLQDFRGIDEYKTSQEDQDRYPRGWWDYIPQAPIEAQVDTRSQGAANEPFRWAHTRASSAVSSHLASRSHNAVITALGAQPIAPHSRDRIRPHVRSTSPPPASIKSRLSKYMPRMQVFREVVKNELTYCAFVTVVWLTVALVSLLSMKDKVPTRSAGLAAMTWILLCIFTFGSFGEVVRRHERDAILQHPSAWDPMYRAELEASRAFATGQSRRPYSPVSVLSRVTTRSPGSMNPFSDAYSMPSADHLSRASSKRTLRTPRRAHHPSSSKGTNATQTSKRPASDASLKSASSLGLNGPFAGVILMPPEPLFRQSALETVHPSPLSDDYLTLGSLSSADSEDTAADTHSLQHLSAASTIVDVSSSDFGNVSTATRRD
ncbi:hypothetical protein BC835DRAFT_1410268 [Cytidiella melzeri]|nr:hypothetical protein BC835DRAFT_1410268 [Cytidiella melzeri]